MNGIRIAFVALVAMAAQAQDYNRGVITRTLPGLRVVVQLAGTQYFVKIRLPCEVPATSSGLAAADRELVAFVGQVVEASSALFGGDEVDSDLYLMRAETKPVFRDYQMKDETTYLRTPRTLISYLVGRGLVAAPEVGGELGEVYSRAWQSAMRGGEGYWRREYLPRNTWIIPRGSKAQAIVQNFWQSGGR